MPEYYVTFGSAHEGDTPPRHRDGYWTITAPYEGAARRAVLDVIGTGWSFIYTEPPKRRHAPHGELHRINVLDQEGGDR
jgi:hypothetical protein